MLSIVLLHCLAAFATVDPHSQLVSWLVTFLKFGTIGFFLISGFLLGERVDRRDPIAYLKRRLHRLFLPWALWFTVACVVLMVGEGAKHHEGIATALESLQLARSSALTMLINSSLWFVPNLLLSIAVLLVFRRYLYQPRLGVFLLAVNLVYVVNIYTLWFSSKHSQALFGFVFYLWLGSYAAHRFDRVSAFLHSVHGAVFAIATVLAGCAAVLETRWLVSLGNPEPSNTLRLTNQIFSVCVVLMLFKLKRATWPRFVDVRRHTLGLYLSHPVALMLVLHGVREAHLRVPKSAFAVEAEGVLVWLAASVVTYGACLGLTIWLEKSPAFGWMVGSGGHEAASGAVAVAANAAIVAV